MMSYLSDRSILFDYGDYSSSKTLSCGCPQGGVLSPLLWTILLNDLLVTFNISDSKVVAFADDITIVCWASSVNLLKEKIIASINFVDKWCQSRKLSINNNKTNILYLFKKNKPVIYHSNHQISPSDSIKILGLTFGNHRHLSKLNFSPHINNIVDKSQRICRILFALIGNTWGLPCKKRINLYKGMIRPAISYGYQIWFNQINKSQIKKIDSLQYRILAKSIQAYCSVSENIVHLICSLPKLSDYFHTHLITKHIHDYHLKAIEVKNIENLLLLKYYNGSNDTFKKFFVSPFIPNYFRPNFYNIQFISNHGKFNQYLFKIGKSSSPLCPCGRDIQCSIHILLSCHNFSYRNLFSNAKDCIATKQNFNIFNQFCKEYCLNYS